MDVFVDCVAGGLIFLGAISALAFFGIALGYWVPYTPNDG